MANEIEIVVRSRNEAGAGFREAENQADGFKKKLATVGAAAAGFIAANVVSAGLGKLKDFIGGSVEAYSNLNESLNAVNKIFGKSQQVILDWGKNNANAYGLSQRAFNDLAVPLGAGLKNMGFSQKVAADNTVMLTKRAADMASVFNTTVPEALEAINSGLKGEADPLERFGVGLSAAAVESAALAETGKKTAKELTNQELATARVNLIMKQTSATAGDFVGTSDGLANSQRIAAAKSEELAAKIGSQLLPAVQFLTAMKLKLMEVVSAKLLPALFTFGEWIKEHSGVVKVLAAIVGGVLVAAFLAWAGAAAAAAAATLVAMAPIILIGAAIGLLVLGFVKLWKSSEKFRDVVTSVLAGTGVVVLTFVQVAIRGFKLILDMWLTVVGGILKGASAAFGWVPGLGDKLKGASKAFEGMRSAIDSSLNKAIEKTDEYRRAVQNMPKNVKLRGDIRDLNSKIDAAKARLKTVPASRRAKILGDIRQLQQKVIQARAALLSIKNRNVSVNVFVSEIRRDAATAARGGKATGGIIGAATGGLRGAWTMVGEQGRELVKLPFGSQVIGHGSTENMLKNAVKSAPDLRATQLANALGHASASKSGMKLAKASNRKSAGSGSDLSQVDFGSGGGSGDPDVIIEFRSDGSRMGDAILEVVRKSIRARGGNVQLVLGS